MNSGEGCRVQACILSCLCLPGYGQQTYCQVSDYQFGPISALPRTLRRCVLSSVNRKTILHLNLACCDAHDQSFMYAFPAEHQGFIQARGFSAHTVVVHIHVAITSARACNHVCSCISLLGDGWGLCL